MSCLSRSLSTRVRTGDGTPVRSILICLLAPILGLLLIACGGGSTGAGNSSTGNNGGNPAGNGNSSTIPNVTGQWDFYESGNHLYVNLVQNGETLTGTAAADGEPVSCMPNVPPGTPGGPCFSVVPCNETVSGSITNAGGINTLTLSGCPGASNTVTFTSTIIRNG